jgi:ADP-ribosyl-[dinitrogen reductase] hydrolase
MSVRAAITVVQANDSLAAILRAAVALTGDVDTVAAIAVGAAANCIEVIKDLPRALLDNLENGPYGRDYITNLDRELVGER